jgi:Tol biopolymer transport system component
MADPVVDSDRESPAAGEPSRPWATTVARDHWAVQVEEDGMRKLVAGVAALALASLTAGALVYAAGARTGRLVFATDRDGVSDKLEIAVVNPDGRGFHKLTHLPSPGFAAEWTMDGTRIVFMTQDLLTGRYANWRMGRDGRRRERLPGDDWDAPAPSGRLVALLGERIGIVTAEGRKVRTLPWRLRRPNVYNGPGEAVWSPDGRYLAVNIDTETPGTDYSWVFVIATDGRSGARLLTPKKQGRGAVAVAWSPDSRRLLIDDDSGPKDAWYTIAPDGSKRRRLPSLTNTTGATAWSPDSRKIAYVVESGGIFEVSEAGGRPRRLVRTRSRGKHAGDVSVDWSSRGELAFSDIGGVYAVRSNGRGLHRITRKEGQPDWSPDGKRLVFSQANEIFVIGRRGHGLRELTGWIWDDAPRWSPDGQRIAFVRGREEIPPDVYGPNGPPPTSARVYVMAANGSKQRSIARGYWPRWSPDGSRLAFVDVAGLKGPVEMGRLRNGRIVIADLDRRVSREIALGTAPNWSPTGDRLAFMRYSFRRNGGRGWEVGQSMLLTAHIDGSDVRQLNVSQLDDGGEVEAALYDPKWSPNGRTIAARAFGSNIQGGGLQLLDAETGTVRELNVTGPSEFEWSPDGTRIVLTQAFVDDTSAGAVTSAVAVIDVQTGATRILAKSTASYESPTWSPDGTQVAFIRCTPLDVEPKECDAYTVSAIGSRPKRLTRTPGIEASVAWG